MKTALGFLLSLLSLSVACGNANTTIDLHANGDYRLNVESANPNPCAPIELGNVELPLSVFWSGGVVNVLGQPATFNGDALQWTTETYGSNPIVPGGISVDWHATWTWLMWSDGTGTASTTLQRDYDNSELCTIQLPTTMSQE